MWRLQKMSLIRLDSLSVISTSFDLTKVLHNDYYLKSSNSMQCSHMHIILCASSGTHITRMQATHSSEGERFYLCALLQYVCVHFLIECWIIDVVLYLTFQAAANALGLFEDDTEAEASILDGIEALQTLRSLCLLFTHFPVNGCAPQPMQLWETFAEPLRCDLQLQNGSDFKTGVNLVLQQIGDALEEHEHNLENYSLLTAVIQSSEIRCRRRVRALVKCQQRLSAHVSGLTGQSWWSGDPVPKGLQIKWGELYCLSGGQ